MSLALLYLTWYNQPTASQPSSQPASQPSSQPASQQPASQQACSHVPCAAAMCSSHQLAITGQCSAAVSQSMMLFSKVDVMMPGLADWLAWPAWEQCILQKTFWGNNAWGKSPWSSRAHCVPPKSHKMWWPDSTEVSQLCNKRGFVTLLPHYCCTCLLGHCSCSCTRPNTTIIKQVQLYFEDCSAGNLVPLNSTQFPSVSSGVGPGSS